MATRKPMMPMPKGMPPKGMKPPMPAQAKGMPMKGLAKPLPAKASPTASKMRGYGKRKV